MRAERKLKKEAAKALAAKGPGGGPGLPQRAAKKKRWEFSIGSIDTPLGSASDVGFKTGRSRARGEEETVGMAEYAPNIQKREATVRHRRGKDGKIRTFITGTDYLGAFTSGDEGSRSGDVLASFKLNPIVFDNTRLQLMAGAYQKFVYRKADVHFIAGDASTDRGIVMGFVTYDVDNPLPELSPENVNVGAAQILSRSTKTWQSQRYPFGNLDGEPMLYIDIHGMEDRLVYQGIFYMLAETDLAADLPIGALWFDYELEVAINSLESNLVGSIRVASMLGSYATATGAKPFGDDPQVNFITSIPTPNWDWIYDPADSSFTLENVAPGLYNVYYSDRTSFTAVTASGNSQVTGELTPDDSSVVVYWAVDGTESDTYTTTDMTWSANASGFTASTYRNTLWRSFVVESFCRSLKLIVTRTTLSTGQAFIADAEMVVMRVGPLGSSSATLAKRTKFFRGPGIKKEPGKVYSYSPPKYSEFAARNKKDDFEDRLQQYLRSQGIDFISILRGYQEARLAIEDNPSGGPDSNPATPASCTSNDAKGIKAKKRVRKLKVECLDDTTSSSSDEE